MAEVSVVVTIGAWMTDSLWTTLRVKHLRGVGSDFVVGMSSSFAINVIVLSWKLMIYLPVRGYQINKWL